MATLIGDVYADSARFHTMIGGASAQHQHPRDSHFHTRSSSQTRDRDLQHHQHHHHQTHQTRAAASPARQDINNNTTPTAAARPKHSSRSSGASRFPSPPLSSSPSEPSSGGSQAQNASASHAVSMTDPPLAGSSAPSSTSTDATIVAPPAAEAMPSPDSDSAPPSHSWHPVLDAQPSIADAGLLGPPPGTPPPNQTTIRVRDLAHIQSLAKADLLTGSGPGILNDPPLQQMKYEISEMPIGDIIEMVAALLTKITTTNDHQHDALNRNANHIKQAQAQAQAGSEGGSGSDGNLSPLGSSVLAFHGKNVPAITILSYLSRIQKYCPTTFEVFLSLLVYFDRMTERVNDIVVKSEESRRMAAEAQRTQSGDTDTVMRDDISDETDSELADEDDEGEAKGSESHAAPQAASPPTQATYFVVDSFNIHRLIIAGVTCASKFFSDVFYTNSRYAKVGGLPLAELNHLELQFLLLNDFRLAVPVEDLEAYATMLVEFYAREVIAQKSKPSGSEGLR